MFLRIHFDFTKIIAQSLVFVILANATSVLWADAFTDSVNDAKTFGNELLSGSGSAPAYQMPGFDTSTNSITIHGGTADAYSTNYGDFFQNPTGDINEYKDLEGNLGGTIAYGNAKMTTLETETSAYGSAYRAMTNGPNIPILTNDPIWNKTETVMTDLKDFAFPDCTETTTTTNLESTEHVVIEKWCNRVYDMSGAWTLYHNLHAEGKIWNVKLMANAWDRTRLYYDLTTGTGGMIPDEETYYCSGGPYSNPCWNAACYTQTVLVDDGGTPYEPDDDVYQDFYKRNSTPFVGYVVPTISMADVCGKGYNFDMYQSGYYMHHLGGVPFMGNEWNGFDPYYDITNIQTPNCSNNLTGIVEMKDWTVSDCEGYGAFWNYRAWKVTEDEWVDGNGVVLTGPGISFVDMALSPSCTYTVNCLDMSPKKSTFNGKSCYMVDSVAVCDGDIGPAPLPEINPFCKRAEVTIDCDGTYNGGLSCFVDYSDGPTKGQLVCPDNNNSNKTFDPNTNTFTDCQDLMNDPQCTWLRQECVGNSPTAGGECMVLKEVYDCGYDVPVEDVATNKQISCLGDVRCLGTDCIDPNAAYSSTQKANEVFAQAGVVESMRTDGTCDPVTGDCTIWEGQALECKTAILDLQDCCFDPDYTGIGDYLSLAYELNSLRVLTDKIDTQILETGYNMIDDYLVNPAKSTWQTVSNSAFDLATEAWDAVGGKPKAFSSMMDSIGSTTSSTTGVMSTAYSNVMGPIMEKTYSLAQSISPDVAQAFFTCGSGCSSTLASQVANGSPLSVTNMKDIANIEFTIPTPVAYVMWAYTAYQIIKLLAQIIWACEEEEFDLAARRGTYSCTELGTYCADKVLGACVEERTSYCCFNTPLARILREQFAKQGIATLGSDENPDCSGISMAELETVDWSKVKLSEWIALLKSSGFLKTPTNVNMENLTGSGSLLNFDGNRENAQERAAAQSQSIQDAGYNPNSVRDNGVYILQGQKPAQVPDP